jgi:hypothetical protein
MSPLALKIAGSLPQVVQSRRSVFTIGIFMLLCTFNRLVNSNVSNDA